MTVVTLEDVARHAGVSSSTASRAFTRPTVVNAATLSRVLSAAEELGYSVPRRDRADTSSWAVGLSVPDIANPVVVPMIKTAQEESRRAGLSFMLSDSDEVPSMESAVIKRLAEHVDGVILASPRLPDDQVQEIAATRPTVLVNREVADVAAVLFDQFGLVQAVDHLHALGHDSIHYLAGPSRSYSEKIRATVIRSACENHGMAFVSTGPSQPTYEAGVRLADIVISLESTAVITFNDLMALGLLTALRVRGVSVPDDVSVVGIDDIWLDDAAVPALTTVRFPWARAGTTAVQLLRRLKDSDPMDSSEKVAELPTELIVRASTASPRERKVRPAS